MVGAIGCSGATGPQDGVACKAAADSMKRPFDGHNSVSSARFCDANCDAGLSVTTVTALLVHGVDCWLPVPPSTALRASQG
jgi:hypothetical protein